jgi:hypothetical protein
MIASRPGRRIRTEVLEEGAPQPRTLSLFPEDRWAGVLADPSIVHVKLSQLQFAGHGNGARAGWRCGLRVELILDV